MTSFATPLRAARRAAIPALGLALGLAVLVDACPALAFTPSSKHGGEATALELSPSSTASHTSSGGASIVRTIVGLLIVIAVIWGLTWILKQVKSGRETRSAGSGLTSLATLALGSGRTLHLVRAGRDYLLVGSAEHGVAHIHRYTESQARDAGLLDLPEPPTGGDDGGLGPTHPGGARRLLQIPGQARPPGVPSAISDALERVREWTVRR
jgi:flagellar protein FliO/FliZ